MPGFDIRTECLACNTTEKFSIDLSVGVAFTLPVIPVVGCESDFAAKILS
jgi:hypothetical protein